MNVKFLILFFICLFSQVNAQSKFTGKFDFNSTTCKFPDSERARQIFPLGIECIQKNIYLASVAEIMTEMIKIDSTFCDAYFWAGYAFRKSDMNKEAVAMYYMADSLAQNKSLEYKQNLATTSMIIGADDLARKKFEEIKEYFPNSPEGFYGVALGLIELSVQLIRHFANAFPVVRYFVPIYHIKKLTLINEKNNPFNYFTSKYILLCTT